MFLGLSLLFKSDLRNSGRICLTAVPHPPPKPGNSNDDKLVEISRFRSPALVVRIDFEEIEIRGKTRRQAVLKYRVRCLISTE